MKILVLGKGISNDGVILLLEEEGLVFDYLEPIEVTCYDYKYVVKAPGIPFTNPVLQEFKKKKIRIITDIELAYTLRPRFYIGVTGSNGKTTTVSLIAHILSCKYHAVACGNIGYSVCKAVVEHPENSIFVVELSSFQLESATIDLNISVLLNVNPCHLDHHQNYKAYLRSKANICLYQQPNHYVVTPFRDSNIDEIIKHSIAKKISYSTDNCLAMCSIRNQAIYYENKKIMKINDYYKKKEYLLSDIMASLCTCLLVKGIKRRDIKKGIKTFREMTYRLTKVNEYIYNDAKSTNPYATIAAIKCLDSIFLICGGYDRKEKLSGLNDYLSKIKAVYAYGATKDKIHNYMKKNNVECYTFSNVEEAFTCALKDRRNEIILYSPMFASFDQFGNYIERGNYFSTLVQKYVTEVNSSQL